MKRLSDFDGMRFLLCIGIALFHYSFRISVKNDAIQNVILTFAYFTDIFFIVSGLFLGRRRNYVWGARHYAGFVGRRLARIYPLHAVVFSCFALISVLTAWGMLHPSTQPNMSWWTGFAQLLLIHNWGMGQTFSYNYVSWSLSALFMMYLCFPLFDLLCKRLGGWLLVIIVAAIIGGDYLARLLGASSLTRIQFADVGVFRALPSFLFGMWLARREQSALPKWLIKIALAACMIVFLFYHPSGSDTDTATLEGPKRLLFLYFCMYMLYAASTQQLYTPLRWSGFVQLARYSFGIFILHPLIGLFFFNALPKSWGQNTLEAVLLIGAGVLVSIGAAIVAYHFFENPVNRWLVAKINTWENRTPDIVVETASPTQSA